MHIGVDLGSTITKTSKGVKFLSGMVEEDGIRDGIKVTLKGHSFITDINDNIELDINKINNENIFRRFYTALALSTDEKEDFFKAVVGYPLSQYNKNKEEFKKRIMENERVGIIVNGKKKIINVKVEIFPEAAGAFYYKKLYSPEVTFIIDIGGSTVNWTYFKEKKLNNYGTLPDGVTILFQRIAERINSNFNTTYDMQDIYDGIHDDFYLEGNRIDVDKIIENETEQYIKNIINLINRKQSIKEARNLIFIGGCMNTIGLYIKNKIEYARVEGDSLFYNALGFEEIAKAVFR
jgi:plasmid segregation protein ParM